jgi:hypothetical protein
VVFSADMLATSGPAYTGPECNPYIMSVASGSLPPGLQLGEPDCTWLITGTPTKAGTYVFTVQITPQPNNLGQPAGPAGTQQLTITIGTGSSDRLMLLSASWNNGACSGLPPELKLKQSDANSGATYTVTVAASGKQVATFTGSSASPLPAVRTFTVSSVLLPPRSVTVTDSVAVRVSRRVS